MGVVTKIFVFMQITTQDNIKNNVNFDLLSNTRKHSKDSDTLSATINFINFSTVSIQTQ